MSKRRMLPPGVIPIEKVNRVGVSVRQGPLGQIDTELNYGPHALNWSDVPIDLHERQIQEYKVIGGQYIPAGVQPDLSRLIEELKNDTNVIASTLVLDRGLIGRVVLVPSTPVLIAQAQYLRGYLFLNPAAAVGLTSAGTLISSTSLIGATTFQSSALGVANYKTLRLTLNVSAFAGAGPVTFDAQTLDPVDGVTWVTTQTVFSITAVGTFYASLGEFGVDTDFRLNVIVPAGTSLTFTMGFVLKDGLEGTSTGVAQTIFIGPSGVTSEVGYPILSGREKGFYLRQNTELYAVTSGPTLPLRIFEL